MPRPSPAFDVDDCVKRYLAGESVKGLGRAMGVDPGVVRRRLAQRGITPRTLQEAKGSPSDEQVDEMARRFLAGETQEEIGRSLGFPQPTVSRWLLKQGVQISRSDQVRRRMARMSPAERRVMTAAAHEAVRGRVYTLEELSPRALARQAHGRFGSTAERLLSGWLASRGVETIPQRAIGPYNVDLAAEPVAVEVFGGHWHASGRHAARLPKRSRYLGERGWNQLIVWVDALFGPLTEGAADDVLAYVQLSRSDPTFRGQYRVIRGDGKLYAAGRLDDDKLSLIPTGRKGFWGRAAC